VDSPRRPGQPVARQQRNASKKAQTRRTEFALYFDMDARRLLRSATVRMGVGVLAGLADLSLELGRVRRAAAREAGWARGQTIGRPKALDKSKAALALRMHAAEVSASTIAETPADVQDVVSADRSEPEPRNPVRQYH
jgi:hypothetical protein